ncbi:NAD(P)/FAD-dependent oxidoreductase [Winogradskyella alexanderae]|uniref:FAD-binding oxidoreductase n=1 Tax=Winogradskyella alexanderae TaxID=2877123 RepID=A0ABS7XPB9_9FLAO|nr:FAD-dependent oxidoreductase [Winogradskyella alexanderae]MCA0131229.1 FAD-binding oxidoreductase [Winogradskyella alexanderae]
MNLSYWEIKTWLTDVDFTIIGSGIVGLSCALELRRIYPNANILVLEKGLLPQGASTKNAGFACFGSLSEIIDDLEHHSEEEVLQLISKRINGLALLRETLGDHQIDYKPYGGYELFLNEDETLYHKCVESKDPINKFLKPLFGEDVFSFNENSFGFNYIEDTLVFNQFEGQIDTGKMMASLLKKTSDSGIKVLNNCHVNAIEDGLNSAIIITDAFEIKSSKVFVATNGFASELIKEKVKPARAQVLITKPIENLKIKGTFHLDRGYYYFRNIDDRILLGGGRNLDFKGEETTEFGETELIQDKLEELLKTTIIPSHKFEIEHSWSGIMGVGNQKKSIVKPMGNNIFCGVRLGGMGVAIGSIVGKDLANLIE